MTQNVLDYSQNPSGIELMDTYLAGMAENQLTNHSGVSRPSYAQAGTFWIDTSTTPWILKQFTGTNDVVVGTLDQTNLYFTARRALADKNGNDITTKYVTVTGTAAKATADADGNTISSTYVKTTGTAAKATADADGNTISSTYAKKGSANTFSGNNTFSGTNTFTGQLINAKSSPYLILQNTGITKGTNPSSTKTSTLVFNPNSNSTSNADCMGRVQCQVLTNGDVEFSMFAHRNIAGDTTSAALTVTNKLDGTKYATGPASDVTNSLVTTTGIDKSQNGCVELGNGIIIQWGKYTGSSGTVTFKTPFSSGTSYGVSTGYVDSARTDYSYGIVNSLTSTGFKIITYGSSSICMWIAIGY